MLDVYNDVILMLGMVIIRSIMYFFYTFLGHYSIVADDRNDDNAIRKSFYLTCVKV